MGRVFTEGSGDEFLGGGGPSQAEVAAPSHAHSVSCWDPPGDGEADVLVEEMTGQTWLLVTVSREGDKAERAGGGRPAVLWKALENPPQGPL